MAYPLGGTWRGRPGFLGLFAYLVLTVPQTGLGCGPDDDCLHDWQCGDSSICIPYEERYQCFHAPVCSSSDECDVDEPCVVRSRRIVDEAPRDPFTSDAPGKRTCGGYAGPAEPVESEGCGSGDDGAGGDEPSSTSTTSSKSSSGSTSSTSSGGGEGGAGGSGEGGSGSNAGGGGSGNGGGGGA